MKLENEESRSS